MGGVRAGLFEAVEALAPFLGAAPAMLTDDQLVGFAGAVEAVGRVTDSLRLAVAGEFDRRSDPSLGEESLARKLGAKKTPGALETVTRTSAADARHRVAEAAQLTKVPVIHAAVQDGLLGRAQASEIIAPILPALPVADPALVESACAQLVELSEALPASALVDAARAWAAVLDPDGIEPEEKSALEKRFLTLGRAKSGLVPITGALTIEQAATVRALLDAYVNPQAGVRFTPAGLAAEGLDPESAKTPLTTDHDTPPRDTRSAKQKRADVLHLVFAAQARAADAPTMGGAHPTLLVTVSERDLTSGTGPAWIDGEIAPVSVSTARRIADAGGYQNVTLGASGEVLNLGRTERCFTPAQRRALAARDKGCVVPGCDIPARWCQIHHIVNWQHGGGTDLDNAALLCWWHHLIIDNGPYQLRIVNGVPEVRWVFGSHASPWVTAVHAPRRGLVA